MGSTLDEIVRGYSALNEEMQVLFQECRALQAKLDGRCPVGSQGTPSQPADIEEHLHSRGGCIDNKKEPCQRSSHDTCTNWLSVLLDHPDDTRRKRALDIQIANNLIDGMNNAARCPVSGKPASPKNNAQPAIGCPFASRQSKLTLPSAHISANPADASSAVGDPIAAELGTAAPTSIPFSCPSGSGDSSTAVCPIRYLDLHSPEEIAEYFQKHKHEIPRSHEVCVRRYQTNSDSVRRLDAKYGNMVSMIQGLSVKHKDLLPPKEEEELQMEASGERVQQWSEEVRKPERRDGSEVKDGREQRFDRPLREVRLGESPTRPWGVPIPVEYEEKAEARQREESKGADKGGCPLGKATEKLASADKPNGLHAVVMDEDGQKLLQPQQDDGAKRPQMIFNGPVFFGYSAEQAQTILQALQK
ncbi:hypothetical protein P152DRAFT_448389 [Eremomyces bilateralis CBS 781.70]|uniref:Uncharacterized protein n=1 Tax=Eremomyces bilateralis CBS 781.70 TaxID=1392243 RepID=A0A6G1G845_9PEZI|nr:uncharacterized protein P152DRAFT_448389 [Eremomyces bilateralis CBS 781.70]KAF1814029.1 hypothetical protein P152DRAFT_448389 [Eremomyces bilateralis CBS 781.70]